MWWSGAPEMRAQMSPLTFSFFFFFLGICHSDKKGTNVTQFCLYRQTPDLELWQLIIVSLIQ